MEYTENKRVIDAITELKKRGVIKSESDIATKMKISRSTISDIVNLKRGVSRNFIVNFSYYLNVNSDYLKSGILPILQGGKEDGPFPNSDVPKIKGWRGVPIYDIPVTAGAVTMIRDEKAPEPAYYLQIPSFKDCTFGARVSGDSMYPEIRNGDYVVCKEVQTLESLIYGDIYLVITKDGIETVKYVHPHENPDWVNLVPYNKSVPTTPMPKSNIFKVYKVKGVLKGY